jgi:hypothetical protein
MSDNPAIVGCPRCSSNKVKLNFNTDQITCLACGYYNTTSGWDKESLSSKYKKEIEDLTSNFNATIDSLRERIVFQEKMLSHYKAIVTSQEPSKKEVKVERATPHSEEISALKKDIADLQMRLSVANKDIEDHCYTITTLQRSNQKYITTIQTQADDISKLEILLTRKIRIILKSDDLTEN